MHVTTGWSMVTVSQFLHGGDSAQHLLQPSSQLNCKPTRVIWMHCTSFKTSSVALLPHSSWLDDPELKHARWLLTSQWIASSMHLRRSRDLWKWPTQLGWRLQDARLLDHNHQKKKKGGGASGSHIQPLVWYVLECVTIQLHFRPEDD